MGDFARVQGVGIGAPHDFDAIGEAGEDSGGKVDDPAVAVSPRRCFWLEGVEASEVLVEVLHGGDGVAAKAGAHGLIAPGQRVFADGQLKADA